MPAFRYPSILAVGFLAMTFAAQPLLAQETLPALAVPTQSFPTPVWQQPSSQPYGAYGGQMVAAPGGPVMTAPTQQPPAQEPTQVFVQPWENPPRVTEVPQPRETEFSQPSQPREHFWTRWKRSMQECFLGYPSEFVAPPLGQTIYPHFKTMVNNGEAALMVLYEFDFMRGDARLNKFGKDRLAKITTLLPRNFFPVIIERTDFPELNEARRLAVLKELALGSFPVPAERVVVMPGISNGLSGPEVELLYRNFLKQVEVGSTNPGTANTSNTGGATGTTGTPGAGTTGGAGGAGTGGMP